MQKQWLHRAAGVVIHPHRNAGYIFVVTSLQRRASAARAVAITCRPNTAR